jgi:CHAT domain-containing protein
VWLGRGLKSFDYSVFAALRCDKLSFTLPLWGSTTVVGVGRVVVDRVRQQRIIACKERLMTSETVISKRTALSRWILCYVLLGSLLPGSVVPFGLSLVRSCFGASRPKLTNQETARLEAAVTRARKLRKASEIPEAIAAFGEVHQITSELYGKDHWRTTDARLKIAHFQKLATLTIKQLKQFSETIRMSGKVFPLYKQGKIPEALKIAVGIPPILTKILGPQDPETLTNIEKLARLHLAMGQHAKALPLFQQNLKNRIQVLGPLHPHTNASLNNLAITYLEMHQHAKALPLLQQSMENTMKTSGPRHPATAAALQNLAAIYKAMGQHAKALPLSQQSLDITRKAYGPKHPRTVPSLSNLAAMYRSMGQYSKALPLERQSLEIRRETLGPQHPGIAIGCAGLGKLYQLMGDYARALVLYKQSLEINRRNFGPKHMTVAIDLSNLAAVYQRMGDHTKAIPLYKQSLEIEREISGQQHPRVAKTLSNMALLYRWKGDYAKALPLLQESLKIRKKALGLQHPDTASSFESLGVIHREMGDYDKALPLLQQSLEITSKVLGQWHPRTAAALGSLVTLYGWKGDYDEAEPLAREAVAISCRNLEVASAIQSGRQRLAMLESLRPRIDAYVYLALNSKRHAESALSNVLAWGRTGLMRQRATRALARQLDLKTLFKKRQAIASQLAKLAKVTPKPNQRKAIQLHWAKMSERLDQIQADLSAKSASFRQSQRKVTADALRRALPENTALIDLLEYRCALPPKGGKIRHQRRLAAFVVRPKCPIVLIDLGDYQYLGKAVHRWRSGLGLTSDSRSAGVLLRKEIWDPLEPHVKGAKTVLVSPIGVFDALPLATLPGKKPGSYLLEDWAICVAPTPLLLLEYNRDSKLKSERPAAGMLLVGDVDYNASQTGIGKKPAVLPGGGIRYSSLPGSKAEIIGIEKIYRSHHKDEQITRLTASSATRKLFYYAAPRHFYLHVATHVVFASPRVKSGSLSGLVLTGANRPDPKKDDGIIMTEEIGLMDLSRTNLVVLSACDTSRDLVVGGEGLLGLQHAFQMAGARSTLASMWKTDDRATMLLMERFYRNMWGKRMGKLYALREAQLWMLREGGAHGVKTPDKNQKTSRPTRLSPFFWGAFVLSGDWR